METSTNMTPSEILSAMADISNSLYNLTKNGKCNNTVVNEIRQDVFKMCSELAWAILNKEVVA